MRLILLGPPGAGKGTQAKVLSQKLNLVHLSTGDIFRESAKRPDEIGQRLTGYMQRGQLVPDEIVNQIVIEKLKDKRIQNRFILDGYPRTKTQATSLDEFLAINKIPLDMVVYMQTSEQVIIDRLTGRRICGKCGANYHIKNILPKKDGICDICGGRLIQRDDDKKETVLKRIKVYNQQTAGLIDYYKNKGFLHTVSGDLEVDRLYKILHELFNEEGLI
ncbi:MAG: adenylate kinase [Candidatus Omnitrophota bacterium]|nr:MAG: adenylate kinase [Candidatus Omnitrophota bacterium]